MAKIAKIINVNDDSIYADTTEAVAENEIVEDEAAQTVEQSEPDPPPKPKARAKRV